MRWLILLLVILFLSNLLSAQDFAKSFYRYESEKKDIAVGYLQSTVIPGGGLFYGDRFELGLVFLGGEIAYFLMVKGPIESHPKESTNFYIIGAAIKILEYHLVTGTINNYNEDLRKRLNLAVDIKNNYQGIKLSYTFQIQKNNDMMEITLREILPAS